MNQASFQPESRISKDVIEDIGIFIPLDAVAFYTEKDMIVFCLRILDEMGDAIVYLEEFMEYDLTELQVEKLKAANCYGTKGWILE